MPTPAAPGLPRNELLEQRLLLAGAAELLCEGWQAEGSWYSERAASLCGDQSASRAPPVTHRTTSRPMLACLARPLHRARRRLVTARQQPGDQRQPLSAAHSRRRQTHALRVVALACRECWSCPSRTRSRVTTMCPDQSACDAAQAWRLRGCRRTFRMLLQCR